MAINPLKGATAKDVPKTNKQSQEKKKITATTTKTNKQQKTTVFP